MNEKVTIRLRDFMPSEDGWGVDEGREVFGKLLRYVEKHSVAGIFRVSLDGVRRTDASFPRESVAELARRFRKKLGFCIVEVESEDVLDNWDAAAQKKEQPLVFWSRKGYRVLGPQPSEGNKQLFDLVQNRFETRAAEVAEELNLKITNASTKLKQLWEQGFILRKEEAAESGGIEFIYFPIR